MNEPAPILNLAAYKFVALSDAPALRVRLQRACEALGLRGTILLAEEGINLFVAGAESAARSFLAQLRADPRFCDVVAKESWSDAIPFRRMLVKVKPEIITMKRPAVRPAGGRAPSVSPRTLARWLAQGHDDEGRDLVLLDTRNTFEVEAGTFEGAVSLGLAKFSDFPAAFEPRAAALAGKTVVSFCTGGIRCEKAALVMRDAGVPHTYQLEGGILKYLEEVGETHWRGSCVVFDRREALDKDLRPDLRPASDIT